MCGAAPQTFCYPVRQTHMKTLTRQYLSVSALATTVLVAVLCFKVTPLYAYLLSINIVGFALMGIDKGAARRSQERVPEAVFLLLSLAAAGVGILLAATIVRHKIRKRFFFSIIITITAMEVILFKLLYTGV